ncbi:MAG: uracil-DNA glycosylase [Planctomycetes bacterium]|nr:uracil-DNA glycosylase [Planctomycetota bacterium]
MGCQKCGLCQTRRQVVFGEGSLDARLMFVSEAPGRDEDFLGRPFVGTSGELLTDIIEKGMRVRREDVFITNVLKCRPPGNRDPLPEEIAACLPCLERQVAIVRPRIIVAVGRVAANILTGQNAAPGELRGKWFAWRDVPLTAIYHPSFLLRMRRSEGRGNRYDRETWADVQMIMRKLGG